ncbi:unannotated protein [freshwater metagenome]|uniref:Unannotated protein n=1 Tax=freshwater metagenome TaxID=449393 RepID=A0A6J6M223_9ZZZZ
MTTTTKNDAELRFFGLPKSALQIFVREFALLLPTFDANALRGVASAAVTVTYVTPPLFNPVLTLWRVASPDDTRWSIWCRWAYGPGGL